MERSERPEGFFRTREQTIPPPLKKLTSPFEGHWYQQLIVNASIAFGISKREIEEQYSYDELITMLDMYAYANADEKEKKRYQDWAVRYKIKMGLPVTRDEAKAHSLFR